MGRKSEINKKDLLNLYEISDEEFAKITDNLYSQKIDYKSLPNLVLLPNVKEELRNELNIRGNLYITKNRLLHTNPIRKNAHKKQGFTKDEYKAIPDTIRKATYALKETDSEYNSFLITALDKNDSTKANCIIFDEDTNGNLLTTIKKVPLLSLRNRTYEIVGTGVEPAISNALREPSTTLTTSPNSQNLTTKEDFVKTQAYADIEERNVALEIRHVLKEGEIRNLPIVTQKEFNRIVDSLYHEPKPDYKNIPNVIRLPGINPELARKLDVKNANFFLKTNIAHVRPSRKGSYNQDLRIEEMKGMLDFIKNANIAYIDNDERHKNFMIVGSDSQDSKKANKIVFNQDELGNYIVTIGKIQSVEFEKKQYDKVAVGVEPTIWREFDTPALATMLRPSTTLPNKVTISQTAEKSNDIIQGQSPAEEERNVALEETNQKEYSSDSITASIKSALVEKAEPLVTIDFTLENYNSLFPRGIVQTPIETVKLGENQFEKLDANNRNRFLLATYQTLAMPDIVIDENRNGSHSHNYIKSFIFDEKTKAVQDIVVSIDGENVSITAHPRDINNIVNKIKTPDQLVYAAAEVGRMIEQRTQYAQSIVNPTRVDRLSTISVPLNKEYSRETALSTIKEISEKTIFSKERNVALEETNIQGDKIMPEKENELYVSEEQALRIQLAREIKQNMPNLSDGERAAAIAILEAGASSQKMSLTDYVQQTFPNGVFGDYDRAQNAAHQQGVEINGAVSVSGFGANARAVIYASKTADFSTWCHELSHIWQAQLTGTLKDDAEKAFQVQDGNWQESIYTFADGHTDTSAEAFAYGFEDFLKHKAGEMATEDKKVIFEKFADYMSRTYNGIKQNIEVSEEIAKVYENFVQLDDNILAEAEKAVRMEKEQEQRINEIFNSPNLKTSQKVSATIGVVSDEFAALASQYGYDIKGYSHTIDNFFVSHAMKQHGDKEAEERRGNIAITHSDIRNVFSVYSHPDYIIFGTKTKTGNPAIVYVKNIGNSTIFVEDVRSGKKELAAQTLYKKFGTIDVSSKKEAPELYAHSDPESVYIVNVKEKFVNEIENGELIFQAAYHGSGVSFDRFNTAQYGLSGEGSMSFGWGTYLTSSEDIARDYAERQTIYKESRKDMLKRTIASEKDDIIKGERRTKELLKELGKKQEEGNKIKEKYGENSVEYQNFLFYEEEKTIQNDYDRLLESIERTKKTVAERENELAGLTGFRNLYSVEIPDGKYLQWNKNLSNNEKESLSQSLKANNIYIGLNGINGRNLYLSISGALGSDKAASEFLKESGYTGISYPAGTIYGNGNDATNYVIFNDDDITIKEHLQFQLVGERSIMRMTQNEERKRILEDLAAAKLMDEKYSNIEPSLKATRIRFATGWEKSADGQWKYELDDSLNRIKSGSLFEKILSTSPEMLEQLTKNTTLTLDDIMEAPELYGVFPFMKNVRVGFYSDPNAFRAVLTPDGIKINTKYLDGISGEKGMKGVLAHEIQHIIQAVEYSGSKGINGESIEQLYNNMMEAMKAASIKRYDYDVSSLEHGLSEYMHDSGEIEARNVARRIFMNASERRHTTLESTEDIARNMQFQIIGEQGAGELDRNTESNERIANLDTAKRMEETGKDYEALKQPQPSLTVEDYHKKWDGITTLDEQSETLHALRVALDDYFENGKRPVNDRFIIGKTPLVLQKTGSDLTEVTVPVSVVKKAVETHGLSQKQVYETLAHIYNPILIFDSDKKATENKVESKLVLTDIFKDEKPLALAVNVNSDVKLKDSNISVEVQDIRSVHDRTVIAKNGTDLIQKWANDGLCRYVDDKKITDWSSLARVYFPIELIQSDNNKILTKSELVNSHTEVEQRNIAPETSEERNAVVAKENEKSLTKEAGKDYEALKQYQQKYPVSTLDVSSDVKEQLNIVFEQINSYFDNGISPKDGRFILPEVPEYMANTGSDKTPISLPVAVIKKARDVHQLNNDEIKNSILKLYDPIAVFESDKEKSENKVNSKLILTDEFTDQSKPIVLAININSNIKISNGKKTLEVQDIRSIHDRTLVANNGTDLIQKWTTEGLCKYANDKKITEWSNVARVYFPIDELNSAENKILTKSELVNSHTEVEQRNVEPETSEERNAVVAVGVAPTIQTLRTRASSTALRASATTVNSNIIQNKEKSTENQLYHDKFDEHKINIELSNLKTLNDYAEALKNETQLFFYNPDLGKIIFDNGILGNPDKDFKGGYGIKHLIASRSQKDNMSIDEISALLLKVKDVVETVKPDTPVKAHLNLKKDGIWVGISKQWNGTDETWIITGFPEKENEKTLTKEATDTIQTVIAQNSYALEHSYIREQVGAVIDSISLDKEKSTEKQTLPPYVKTLNSLIDQAVKEEKISVGKTQDGETKQKKQIPPNLTKKGASDFLRAVQEGTAPFFNMQNDDFGKITMTPQLIVNAQTGLPFKDEAQLLAQIYSAEQDMNGQIVTSMEGAKEAGTYIKKCDEAMKNFVLVNQQHLSGENKVIPTRYFSPEAAENPDMVYENVLHKNRPAKIKSFRKLCLHFERLPEGQKDIQTILTKIAWEHLKEIQRELKLPDGWKTENLTEKDILEKKEYIKNYFEKVPARERTVFQETFGICTDVKKEYGDPAFSDKTRKIMDDKLTQFIKDNSFSAEYLAAFTKEEYDKLEDWKKEKGRQNKIEAVGIKEPEVYLGRYLAACNSHAEFITDAETIKVIKEKLSTKLKQNYRLEKYDILKEIGMQAGNICKETMKQNVFSKAHSHDKKQELSVQKDKQHPPVGMGASK